MNNKILELFWISLIFIIGIFIGLLIGNFPYIKFNSSVGFGDIANFILAVFMTIFVSVGLNSWLDNKKYIKGFLIDEIKGCVDKIETIGEKIDKCVIVGNATRGDMEEIMSLFRFLNTKISSIKEQLKMSFDSESEDIRKLLGDEYLLYWDKVTSRIVPVGNFDRSSAITHVKAFSRFEGCLKKAIHVINRF